jgi:hypothetical protein
MQTNPKSASDHDLVVEIVRWNWNLHVGLSPEQTPMEYRFQGGLSYTRGIHLDGSVLAPPEYKGKDIRVWVSPIVLTLQFGADDMDEVGRLYIGRLKPDKLEAMLLLPEGSLDPTLRGLASRFRLLYISIFDVEPNEASVSSFEFASTLRDGAKGH